MYRLLKDYETIAAGDRFDYWAKNSTPFIEVGLGYPEVGAFGSARIGCTVLEAKKADGSDDLRVRRKVDAAYVVKHFAAVQEANNSQNVEIGRLRQLLANQQITPKYGEAESLRVRNRVLERECDVLAEKIVQLRLDSGGMAFNLTALHNENINLRAKLTGSVENNTRLQRELHSTEMSAELYRREYLAAVDACAFLQDEKLPGFLLGQRCTVEGVAALRAQRDALRSELKDAKAELAILRPRDVAYYNRIQRLEAELRELEQPRYRGLFTGERLQAGDECLVAGRWQAISENVIRITDCNNAGVNAGYFFRRKIV